MALEFSNHFEGKKQTVDTEIEGATQEELDAAEAIVNGDPYLASDPQTEQILENDGIAVVEGVRRKINLPKFLEARRLFLAFERIKSVDPIETSLAQEQHELDKARILN